MRLIALSFIATGLIYIKCRSCDLIYRYLSSLTCVLTVYLKNKRGKASATWPLLSLLVQPSIHSHLNLVKYSSHVPSFSPENPLICVLMHALYHSDVCTRLFDKHIKDLSVFAWFTWISPPSPEHINAFISSSLYLLAPPTINKPWAHAVFRSMYTCFHLLYDHGCVFWNHYRWTPPGSFIFIPA